MSGIEEIGADVFRQEAGDLVHAIERGLLDLVHRPEDMELVNAVFRDLHTVKGSGAMFGFVRMSQFVHEFETVFDKLRRGEARVTASLIAVSLAACDQIGRLMAEPEAAEAGNAAILSALRAAVAGDDPAPVTDLAAPDAPDLPKAAATEAPPTESPPTQAPTLAPPPASGWRIRFHLNRDALRLGHNPLLLLDELRDLGPARVTALTEGIPPLDQLNPSDCLLGWQVEVEGQIDRAAVDAVFMFHIDDMLLSVEPLSPLPDSGTATPAANLPPPYDLSDDPAPEAQAESQAEPRAEAQAASPAAAKSATPPPPARPSPPAAEPGDHAPAAAGDTMRVATVRLDELMDRVGELVIAEARLQALALRARDPALLAVAEDIQRLSSGLRHATMSMRMVPIGSILGRFRRLMRDLSSSLGKPLTFRTHGEETELDKTVIELLADPLVHILRNSADHGLESAETRIAAGKPASGTVELSASYSGAEVLITVRDDGRGLDIGRIRRRAIEAGLITAETDLPDGDLYRLIFEPGFSTAETITAVSGRGVGMDVVKRTITALRGRIDLASEPGHGTTVTLRLPLTLAIIDGLLVEVGGEHYTIPLAAVEECVELPPALATTGSASSFLSIRGGLVPFIRMRSLFEVTAPQPEFQKVVVISSSGSRVGLVVDRIVSNNQTVIKQLSQLHAGLQGFSGATILGDGTVALILDVAQLVTLGRAIEDRARTGRAA